MKDFGKKDLKTGMIARMADGDEYVVMMDTDHGDVLCSIDSHNWADLSEYNESLVAPGHSKSERTKIVKVWGPENVWLLPSVANKGEILFNAEIPEYTMEEAIEKMGHPFKIKK